jgi:lipopolysaccharide export LptBFGC system permease protein LptF
MTTDNLTDYVQVIAFGLLALYMATLAYRSRGTGWKASLAAVATVIFAIVAWRSWPG